MSVQCIMMVLFQRSIIYMGPYDICLVVTDCLTRPCITGYVPLGAREQQLKDTKVAEAMTCEEVQIPSDKGVTLYGILVRRAEPNSVVPMKDPKTVLFYLQGPHISLPLWCGH